MITEQRYLEAKKIVDAYESKQLNKPDVMPRSIPDSLYILIEEAKCKRYGGVFSQIDKQVEYCHGQCDTIDIIEEWLHSL